MTPEQRIAELERKIALLESVMDIKTTTVDFRVPVQFTKQISLNGLQITSGTGVPSYVAPQGSLFLRTDGGVSSTLYANYNGGTGWDAD